MAVKKGEIKNNLNRLALDFELENLIADNGGKAPEAKSIRNIAIILSCISNRINTVGEIAECTTVSRSTLHRILHGLEKSLLVIHDPVEKKYYLGAMIRRIVSKPMVTHEYLVNCAKQEMQRLAGITGETIVLAVKIGLTHAVVHSVPSSYEFRLSEPTHRVGPLHKGAGGKVLLAQLGDKELHEVLKNIRFEFSVSAEKEKLMEEITSIRHRGYTLTTGETIQWSMFIAAPVRGYEVPVELSIIGLEARIKPNTDVYIERLLETTDKISRILINIKK
jgi:IclR family transcriptional regulator, KDG regulon repressor